MAVRQLELRSGDLRAESPPALATETERMCAAATIEAAPEAVFATLADPSARADIDGTGWVLESLDGDLVTAAGQVFLDHELIDVTTG
jgi:hypothetical protein